jgi:hypothetical protein
MNLDSSLRHFLIDIWDISAVYLFNVVGNIDYVCLLLLCQNDIVYVCMT